MFDQQSNFLIRTLESFEFKSASDLKKKTFLECQISSEQQQLGMHREDVRTNFLDNSSNLSILPGSRYREKILFEFIITIPQIRIFSPSRENGPKKEE